MNKKNARDSAIRDSIVVTKTGEILEVYEGEYPEWNAYPVEVARYNPELDELRQLPWHLVGVHRYFQHDRANRRIVRYEDVARKAMMSGKLLMEYEVEQFMSKVDD